MADVPFIPFNSPFSKPKLQEAVHVQVGVQIASDQQPTSPPASAAPWKPPPSANVLDTISESKKLMVQNLGGNVQMIATDLGVNHDIFNKVMDVSRYTPTDPSTKEMWSTVGPTLLETVKHVCRYDRIAQEIFWEISTDLAIGATIQTVLSINPQVGREKLTAALHASSAKMAEHEKKLTALDNTIVARCETSLEIIMKSLGDKAISSLDETTKHLEKMSELRDKIEKLLRNREALYGELARISFLLTSTEKHVLSEADALAAERARLATLQDMNMQSQKKLDLIPRTKEVTYITTHTYKKASFFWGLFESHDTYNTSHTRTEDNPTYLREKALTQDLVNSRINQMASMEGTIRTQADATRVLEKQLGDYKGQEEAVKKQITDFNEKSIPLIEQYEKEFTACSKQVDAIRKSYDEAVGATGLHGQALFECCAKIKGLSGAQRGSYSQCTGLKGFVNLIKTFYGVILETALHPSTTDEALYVSVNEIIQAQSCLAGPMGEMRQTLQHYRQLMLTNETK